MFFRHLSFLRNAGRDVFLHTGRPFPYGLAQGDFFPDGSDLAVDVRNVLIAFAFSPRAVPLICHSRPAARRVHEQGELILRACTAGGVELLGRTQRLFRGKGVIQRLAFFLAGIEDGTPLG
jgi:hypothetical protein